MINIYIVNLLRDIERREFMISQLEKLDFPYVFVEAIDKRKLHGDQVNSYDDEAVQKRVGRSLTAGEIACALSHANTWKQALAEGVDQAIILEDDAEIGPEFTSTINELASFPQDWSMLNFCTKAPQESTGISLPNGIKVGKIKRKMNGTVAYCVNRKGLNTMLEHFLPLKAAADGMLSSMTIMGFLRSYGTSPQIVRPSPRFDSAIWTP